MKALHILLLSQTAAAVFAALALPLAAHASEQSGVTCPADTQATLSSGVLKCKKLQPKVLASICSGLSFTPTGSLKGGPNFTMNPTGSDTCLPSVSGSIVPSSMQPPTPGIDPPASAFLRDIHPTGPDVFKADVYVFPAGAIFVGNAYHGVKCASGFDAVGINSGRGLRCEDVVVKKAVCDGFFTPERKTGRDLCVMKDVFGNRVEGQYTIPANVGYVGLTGNPETHGWNLDTDRSGNTDYWLKEQKTYSYPVSF